MPDKEKTNNKTITIKEGIDLFVIFTSNRESKLSVIVKATILVKTSSIKPIDRILCNLLTNMNFRSNAFNKNNVKVVVIEIAIILNICENNLIFQLAQISDENSSSPN